MMLRNGSIACFNMATLALQSNMLSSLLLLSTRVSSLPIHLQWLCQSLQSSNEIAHDLALRYHNRVIHYLRETYYACTTNPDTVMILCIMLVCLEQFRRGDTACITHLVAGLRKLHWWRSSTRNYNTLQHFSKQASDLINNKITLMLQRLRMQVALCMDQRHLFREVNTLPCFTKPNIPVSYSTIASARVDFVRKSNQRHKFTPCCVFCCTLRQ